MNNRQEQIDALKDAMQSAQEAMASATEELARLEDIFPEPAPKIIQKMKERISNIIQNWTDARNFADTQLRQL